MKLQGVLSQINGGNNNGATNQLNAFINQVNAMVHSGALSAAQGQGLIDAANQIIAAIAP